jgi:hypothetical protein
LFHFHLVEIIFIGSISFYVNYKARNWLIRFCKHQILPITVFATEFLRIKLKP